MLDHDDTAPYLTTELLAMRYGIAPATIKGWRTREQGPPYYRVSHIGKPVGTTRVRYRLADVLAWEQANNITPIQ